MKKHLLQVTIAILMCMSTSTYANDKVDLDAVIKEAKKGNINAQYNLGIMYYEGIGVRQNYSEAIKWYEKAAKQGDAVSQGVVGLMYQ